ncbi:hypothetical protein ACFX1Q_043536 [Malus domestica]
MLCSCSSSSPLHREAYPITRLSPSSSTATTPKFASTVCCSLRNPSYIPKLEPFSRSKFDRGIKDPPLIEKCKNELFAMTVRKKQNGVWRKAETEVQSKSKKNKVKEESRKQSSELSCGTKVKDRDTVERKEEKQKISYYYDSFFLPNEET